MQTCTQRSIGVATETHAVNLSLRSGGATRPTSSNGISQYRTIMGTTPVQGTNQYVGMRAISRHTTAREGFRHVCFTARNRDPLLDWASGKPVTQTAILIYQTQTDRGFSRIAFQVFAANGSHSASRRARDPLRRVATKRLNCCRTALQGKSI
jgi:hypothetical protein